MLVELLLILLVGLIVVFWLAYASRRNFLSYWTFLPEVRQRLGSFVATPSGRAHYRHVGKGKSDRLLVVMAGIGHDPSFFPEIIDYIGQQHEMIAIDLCGRGFSDAGQPPYSTETYARFVRDVLEALSLDKRPLIVCGISFGGTVAVQLATTTSAVVGACLVVPAGLAMTPVWAASIGFIRMIPRPIMDVMSVFGSIVNLLALLAKQGARPEHTEPGYEARSRRTWVYSAQDLILNPSFCRVYLHTCRSMPWGNEGNTMESSYKKLKRFGKRVQVFTAEKDDIIPADRVEAFFQEELPEAIVVRLKGGHEVHWDRPRELSEMISVFCKGFAS